MKVAYVFALPRSASYKLGRMILPQLEACLLYTSDAADE